MDEKDLKDLLKKRAPRLGIPSHVCTCGAKGCMSMEQARKIYPWPWDK